MVEVLASLALTTSAASCPHLAAKIAANFVKSMTWEQKDVCLIASDSPVAIHEFPS